jgi:hypothetical protein
MKLPGFNAEASVYTTTRRYYAGMATAAGSGVAAAAQKDCPPRCIEACEHGCRADGLSPGDCGSLCQRDCSAYTAGQLLGCGPCVDNVQTCTVCGGGQTTIACGSVPCGNGSCPLPNQCCDGNTCCPADATCCHDGHGCCPAGQQCRSVSAFGLYYCIPNWLSGLF